ncbi:MAG: nuclear transport factor 2 family protein [Gemmatimonadales bacterium]
MPRVTLALAALFLAGLPVAAQSPDREGVAAAAMDYLDAFYQGDSTKLVRSIRPEFVKLGYWRPADSTRYAPPEAMSWQEALAFIRRVKETRRFPPATAPKTVEVLDVQDQTAAAKVTAWWGTDYLLMGRYDGRWMIIHVLWQSPPKRG